MANQPYSGVKSINPGNLLERFKRERHILEYTLKRIVRSGNAHDQITGKP